MNSEDTVLIEINQTQKDNCCVIDSYELPRVSELRQTDRQLDACLVLKEGTMRSSYLVVLEFWFFKIKRVLEMNGCEFT